MIETNALAEALFVGQSICVVRRKVLETILNFMLDLG